MHYRFVFICGILIAGLVYAIWQYLGCYPHQGHTLEQAAQIGDSYGMANSFFSAMALIGVVVAIVLQSHELKLQREELARSAEAQVESQKALADQAQSSFLTAYLNAASTTLSYQKSLHKSDNLIMQEAVRATQGELAKILDSLLPVLWEKFEQAVPHIHGNSLIALDRRQIVEASSSALQSALRKLRETNHLHDEVTGDAVEELSACCRQLYETLQQVSKVLELPQRLRGPHQALFAETKNVLARLRQTQDRSRPIGSDAAKALLQQLITQTDAYMSSFHAELQKQSDAQMEE